MKFLKVAIAVVSVFFIWALINFVGISFEADISNSTIHQPALSGAAVILAFTILSLFFLCGTYSLFQRKVEEISTEPKAQDEIILDWPVKSK